MVVKLLDGIMYCTGALTLGSLALLWNRKIITYDHTWNRKPYYRKVQYFKYGIIPEKTIFETSKDNIIWYSISDDDFNSLKYKPDLELSFDKINNFRLNLVLTNTKESNK